MAAITSNWTRFMAVGCSHGRHIDAEAKKVVFNVKKKWIRPGDLCLHLGDAVDTAAFRSGARGIDADSAEPVAPDIDGGLMFLKELRPDIFLCGNHEARLWHLRESPNAVIAYASHKAIEHLEDGCSKIGTRMIPYDGINQVYKRADITFLHGTWYAEAATRDYAEAYGGTVVHAHTHRPFYAPGRTFAKSQGFCVGTLTRMRSMGYSLNRRATMAWGQGVVLGEFREGKKPSSVTWLFTGPSSVEDSGWRLPF